MSRPPSRSSGFTLIELMVVVAIVAIIAIFAVPAFTEQLNKSRRSEAISGLQDFQLKMERWRASHPTYATGGVGTYPSQAATAYYTFAIQGTPDATSYTLRATGLGPQSTGPCATMEFQVAGTVTTKSPSPASSKCWR